MGCGTTRGRVLAPMIRVASLKSERLAVDAVKRQVDALRCTLMCGRLLTPREGGGEGARTPVPPSSAVQNPSEPLTHLPYGLFAFVCSLVRSAGRWVIALPGWLGSGLASGHQRELPWRGRETPARRGLQREDCSSVGEWSPLSTFAPPRSAVGSCRIEQRSHFLGDAGRRWRGRR